MSEQSTPASTSTTTGEKPAPTLAEEVREYKTNELIEFLRKGEGLELDEDDLEILRKQKISGRAFLKLTEQKLERYGMKDLEGVLKKFGIDGKEIGDIPPFKPETEKIEDDDEKFQYCINHIKFEMIDIAQQQAKPPYCQKIHQKKKLS
ncbi:hypothetical protein Glove_199g191 [Diversispora epigaea]|uniref:SAM domain-containing protein n=1 Tax=Diversispora epigaea TaxID=1348612 RepID=A0A397IK55_9GLOM|nr:hypothetical protein Glove_199g191 [Diversispora epigaea]